jgi:hypothetical protein
MPRVIPTGLDVRVMPQAPNIGDPRSWVFDTTQALESAKAGLSLGSELARIQDLGDQINLERARRKAELAQLDHAELLRQSEAKTLPARVEQALAEAEAARTQATLNAARAAGILPYVGNEAELFKATLDTNIVQQSNLLSTAKANSGFSTLSTPEQTQALAAAQALGSWGVKSGELSGAGGDTPYPFRKTDTVEELDPNDGNTYQTDIVRDTRTGEIISTGARRLQKLGQDEKSVMAASRDATALIQTLDMVTKLETTLDEYGKANKGGVAQAAATVMANEPGKGVTSVVRRALGAKMQSAETTKVATAVQSLENTIGNTLFGAALTQNETARLAGMVPTVADLADPARALTKLKETRDFLETKLRPYKDRGILEKMQLRPAEPAATAPGAAPTPVASGPQEGAVVKIKVAGQWIQAKVVRDPATGKLGYQRL